MSEPFRLVRRVESLSHDEARTEVARLRATIARIRVEIDRLSKSPSLACQTVAACVLAILDGKEGA